MADSTTNKAYVLVDCARTRARARVTPSSSHRARHHPGNRAWSMS